MRKNPQLELIGQRLRALRKSKGYSQDNLALEAELARSYYSGIERGYRNLAALNLIKIADTLDCEIGDLFPSLQDLRKAKNKAAK